MGKDNGAGIPAAVLRQVFDMFAQVNRTRDRVQGGPGALVFVTDSRTVHDKRARRAGLASTTT